MSDLDPTGAGADGLLARFVARLDVSLGRHAAAVTRAARTQAALDAPVFSQASIQPLIFSTGANAVNVGRFGGPDQGHFWYVRSVKIGGLTTTTAAAGRADLFKSASDLRQQAHVLTGFSVTDWQDQATTLPAIAFYSRGALTLRFNEELFVVFTNGTNLQQYVATCTYEDFEEGAVREGWAV